MLNKNGKYIIGGRRKSRILALNALYLVDLSNIGVEKAIEFIFLPKEYPEPIKRFTSFLVIATLQNLNLIDEIIRNNLKNWVLERLNVVDRNLLRLATCEMICCPQTPVSVIINEAIEIAKMYSTKDSGKFINGVLDKVKTVRKNKELISKFIEPENAEECKKILEEEGLL